MNEGRGEREIGIGKGEEGGGLKKGKERRKEQKKRILEEYSIR